MSKNNKFTAKIITPKSETPRFLPGCILYKNKIVQVFQIGVGKPVTKGGMFNGEGDTWEEYPSYKEAYRPFFNSFLLERDGKVNAAKKAAEVKGWTVEQLDEWLDYFFPMGASEGGYFTSDSEADKRSQIIEAEKSLLTKEIPINIVSGIFGYKISERLPTAIWALVKPFAKFHDGGDNDREWAEDMGNYHLTKYDLKGWFYGQEAITALLTAGYPVEYLGEKITSIDDISLVDKKIAESRKTEAEKEKIVLTKARKFNKTISEHPGIEAAYCSEEETEQFRNMPNICLLGYNGPDIYGGGSWFHIVGENLYVVHNNGHDGDDWSRNNYKTGGAGAICYRLGGMAYIIEEIKTWIDSLGDDAKYLPN